MIATANLGREADCLEAIAAGISGTLSDAGAVAEEWSIIVACKARLFFKDK